MHPGLKTSNHLKIFVSLIFSALLVPVTAMAETEKLEAAQETGVGNSENLTLATSKQPDLAYGAYQRGYYLTAFELALPRAKLGDPAAQTLIAELYDKGLGVGQDKAESTAWYKIASGNNALEAQFAYAVKLHEGKYVDRDRAESKRLMKLAADRGHATAAFNYAQTLLNDRPTSHGIKLALPYLELAAANRVSDSYFTLAQIYESGKLKGFPQMELAQKWLVRAAQAGIDTAQVKLGIWLANGKAGPKNEIAAFGWMLRAAITGNIIAQNRLAKMLAQGIGTERNEVEAAKWHILARRAGLNDAYLDEFMNSLDKEKLSKALKIANRWPSR